MWSVENFFNVLKNNVSGIKISKTNGGNAIKDLLFPALRFSPQSISIKFGILIEKTFNEVFGSNRCNSLRLEFCEWARKNNEESKELDYLEEIDGVIYHFEVKCNIDVDSDKKKMVEKRVRAVKRFFAERHPEFKVVSALFCMRNPTGECAKNRANKDYHIPVMGYCEVFAIFGIKVSPKCWEENFKEVGDVILSVNKEM